MSLAELKENAKEMIPSLMLSNEDIVYKLALNTEETCELLSLKRNVLDTLRKQGLIKCIKIGKQYRYPIKEIQAFLEKNVDRVISFDGIKYE